MRSRSLRCATDVRRYLDRYMRTAGLTHASVDGAARRRRRDCAAEPPRHGSQQRLRGRSARRTGNPATSCSQSRRRRRVRRRHVADRLDAEHRLRVSRSSTSAIAITGCRRSPTARCCISTQAATLPSVTLSNYAPLTRFELALRSCSSREMSESEQHRVRGRVTTRASPRLAGLHLSIEPAAGWSLGVSRIMQYGGGERSGTSFGDLIDAFFNPSRLRQHATRLRDEFGNQVAAFTAAFVFPGRTPFAVYFEYAGEDTSTRSNFRLGNSALSAGITFPTPVAAVSISRTKRANGRTAGMCTASTATACTNDGHVLGHWGGDCARLRRRRRRADAHAARSAGSPSFGGAAAAAGAHRRRTKATASTITSAATTSRCATRVRSWVHRRWRGSRGTRRVRRELRAHRRLRALRR